LRFAAIRHEPLIPFPIFAASMEVVRERASHPVNELKSTDETQTNLLIILTKHVFGPLTSQSEP
jgi:hypothetical protein